MTRHAGVLGRPLCARRGPYCCRRRDEWIGAHGGMIHKTSPTPGSTAYEPWYASDTARLPEIARSSQDLRSASASSISSVRKSMTVSVSSSASSSTSTGRRLQHAPGIAIKRPRADEAAVNRIAIDELAYLRQPRRGRYVDGLVLGTLCVVAVPAIVSAAWLISASRIATTGTYKFSAVRAGAAWSHGAQSAGPRRHSSAKFCGRCPFLRLVGDHACVFGALDCRVGDDRISRAY